MVGKNVLLVVLLVFVSAVFLAACTLFSPENRAEILTQQNCLRGCIDRCPPAMAGYRECAANCGTLCKEAGQASR
jgi:hypothetical protein